MYGWEFPPQFSGGLGVACLGLTNGLVNNQVEVTFVLPRKMPLASDKLKFIFADVPRIKIRTIDSPLHPYITSKSYLESFGKKVSPIYGSTLFAEVARYAILGGEIAAEEEFDVIHAHDWLTYGAGIIAKQISGKPLVVHMHATSFDRSGWQNINKHVYDIEKKGLETADKVIAVSNYTKSILVNQYGIDPAKICTVHNGIDTSMTPVAKEVPPSLLSLKEAGNKLVLFLGRHTIQKGGDYFLRAAKRVLEYDPNVVFIMVGGGDMEGQLIQLAADLGISDKVIFPGFLRGEEKAQVYKGADLFIMPSVSEPFGLVALESLLNGTPTIVSKQSGVSEVLSHALKADFWDIDEMTNQIISVLHHKPLHKELTDNGMKQVGKITWDKAAKKVKEVYRKAIKTIKDVKDN